MCVCVYIYIYINPTFRKFTSMYIKQTYSTQIFHIVDIHNERKIFHIVDIHNERKN